MATPMIQVVKEGGIEQFERTMPAHYWLRNKKQSIKYAHDTPFATERQLEDQRLLMLKNKNPQLLVPTKVDKVRSQVISSTIGSSRPVAVKANVLNKIVREASGIHNYTIVAPLKMKYDKPKYEKLEPETNPRVRPYAKEAKMKPVLCSFGHRPRSASRTFHPATMKFRLKHGEIASGGDDVRKTGFGLPVSVLAQVLKAPKIHHPGDGALFGDDSLSAGEEENEEEFNHDCSHNISGVEDGDSGDRSDLQDLFFTESEHKNVFRPVNKDKGKDKKKRSDVSQFSHSDIPINAVVEEDSSLEKPSWVSSLPPGGKVGINTRNSHSPGGSKPPAIVYPEQEQPYDDGRPAWDEAHHCVRHTSNYVFQMRASGLNTDAQKLSLGDRLKRFASLSVAETQPVLFCTEKQQTDKKILAGIEHKVPRATSHHCNPVYFDPNDTELRVIQHYRKQDLRAEKERRKAKEFQKLLKTIPKVDYFPTTRLAEMYSKTGTLGMTGCEGSIMSGLTPIQPSLDGTSGLLGASQSTGGLGSFAPGEAAGTSATTATPTAQNNSTYSSILQSDLSWQTAEQEMKAAMRAARAGDTRALVEFNLRCNKRQLTPLEGPQINHAEDFLG